MYLDRENARWLGVLAGIANWLDVPATLVRIVFVICVIAWPPFILGYFILYFCLDREFTPDRVRDYFNSSATAEHFRQLNYRKPIYRNERKKRIAGVCAGIADYLEVSTFTVRVVTLLSLFVFGPFTFWAYLICWVVFDPDPYLDDNERYRRRVERRRRRDARRRRHAEKRAARMQARHAARSAHEDYGKHSEDAQAETGAAAQFRTEDEFADDQAPYYDRSECVEIFSTLERRLRDIEAYMTSKRFRLHCQINRI